MSINTPIVIEVKIKCPNCKMQLEHSYTKDTYSPLYTECSFCGTKYRWSKTKTIEIIPASNKQHHYNYTI